jgi:hypothetical protein
MYLTIDACVLPVMNRLIDLIWRLSTYAVRVTLESLPAYKVVPPPSTENASVTEAIMALKVSINSLDSYIWRAS